MKICFSLSEVYIFRCSNDADGDVTSTCIEKKGIEEFVIMDEEVKMKPERVSEDYFGELRDPVTASRANCATGGFLDNLIACN
jgi:hypothetical protein